MARSLKEQKRKPGRPAREAQTGGPVLISRDAIYTRREAVAALRMDVRRFGQEVRAGRIRCRQDGIRQLFMGQWLIDWVEQSAK